MTNDRTYTCFMGETLIASGTLPSLLPQLKARFDRDGSAMFLIFEDETGRQVDFDLRGSLAEVLEKNLPLPPRSGPGRPSLGVTAREVTLLPRHWEWLEQQPNGASAALRRLVEQATKQDPEQQRARQMRDSAARFLSAIAGNFPGYEEATRALYAGDRERFQDLITGWPADIRAHVMRLLR